MTRTTTETPERAKIRHARNRQIDNAIDALHDAVAALHAADTIAGAGEDGPGHRYAADVWQILDDMAWNAIGADERRRYALRDRNRAAHAASNITSNSTDQEEV